MIPSLSAQILPAWLEAVPCLTTGSQAFPMRSAWFALMLFYYLTELTVPTLPRGVCASGWSSDHVLKKSWSLGAMNLGLPRALPVLHQRQEPKGVVEHLEHRWLQPFLLHNH